MIPDTSFATPIFKSYSHGKLLLTGDYVVLDGAFALALPTKFGQDLVAYPLQESVLIWESYTNTKSCWFTATFTLPNLRLTSATFSSESEGSAEFIAETLQGILLEAKKLAPPFLTDATGYLVTTTLEFPRDWGLGSSSTLLNNIANWAKIDAYTLLWNSFSGSAYDIACAQHSTPILYQLTDGQPTSTPVVFNPQFATQLFFVHLNQKQNSREGIARYTENRKHNTEVITRVSEIAQEMIQSKTISEFEGLLNEHEQLIAELIQLEPVQKRLFPDYFGTVKSLGAWGGDFVLVTGNEHTPSYFKQKGFSTILPFKEMVLSMEY